MGGNFSPNFAQFWPTAIDVIMEIKLMSDFNKAIDTILKHEGGYANVIADRGLATNYGISLRFLKDYTKLDPKEFDRFDIDDDGDIDYIDIQNLPKNDAIYLYEKQFWNKYNCGLINDQALATKYFDLCVNMGGPQAGKCLQRAVRATNGMQLKEDGVVGIKTLTQVNTADHSVLLAALKSEAAGFYRLLVKADPSLAGFLLGWLQRSYA